MSETAKSYDISTDGALFDKGEFMDVAALAASQTPWWNRTLSEVNNAWVRLGVMEGDFHWHKHDDTDEFFLVLEGRLEIELENDKIMLEPGQGVTVPKGAMHFPRSHGRSVVLMVESAGVVPTGS